MINVSESTMHLRAELMRLSTELAAANSDVMVAYRDNPDLHLDRELYFRLSCKVNDLTAKLITARKAFTDSILADIEFQESLYASFYCANTITQ